MSNKSSTVEINGIKYKKSSFSDPRHHRCVGVSFQKLGVFVVNTKTNGPVVEFTHEEWVAFIKGVKAGEFDIGEL